MDGFTLVLLAAWAILLATYGGMFYLDQATKKAREKRAQALEQAAARRR
ncbi:MAG: hypothetical protein HY648_02355 [Acidobacteria bacterium]|nr:hypothetical protein [Acidobacteriota bacterium]